MIHLVSFHFLLSVETDKEKDRGVLQEVRTGIRRSQRDFQLLATASAHCCLKLLPHSAETGFYNVAKPCFRFGTLLPHLFEFCDYHLRIEKYYFLFIWLNHIYI